MRHWKTDGLSDQTVRNRLTWLRWWAYQVGKPGLLPNKNDIYGLAERTRFSGNRAQRADAAMLASLISRMLARPLYETLAQHMVARLNPPPASP